MSKRQNEQVVSIPGPPGPLSGLRKHHGSGLAADRPASGQPVGRLAGGRQVGRWAGG